LNGALPREKEPNLMTSSSAVTFERIAIVGLGLIGGSWAMALERAGVRARRIGCDEPQVLKRALASGAIDEGFADLAPAVHDGDLVILAAPVGTILDQLAALMPLAPPKSLVTDTGSTKEMICARARKAFGDEPLFIGGHPLAGKERSGFEQAEASLFDGAFYVLAPLAPEHMADGRAQAFVSLLKRIGAHPLVMEAKVHDRSAAFLSHLPQLVSTGLASAILRQSERDALPLEMAASGLRDLTRLAESPYGLWKDICVTNGENIEAALDAMIEVLKIIRAHLGDRALEREFAQAAKFRKRLRNCE
jgi:prephenate dehydrogenase